MIGYYNYTVILTYLSLLSAGTGIVVSLSGPGHPFIGSIFLLFCGLCDAFDGKVARTKKGRDDLEEKFGIQIDSLSDIVAFGVLPACIGAALIRYSSVVGALKQIEGGIVWKILLNGALFGVLVLYILAALIRLAYFNVTEEERQKTEEGTRKYYVGLPVTSAALIFPFIIVLNYVFSFDIAPIYLGAVVLTGLAFISKFKVRKPGLKGIIIMVLAGLVEFLFIVIGRMLK